MGLLVLVALAGCGEGADRPPGAAGTTASGAGSAGAQDIASDRRLDWLLAPCAKGSHYDVNTADTLGILAETLERAPKAESLRRAKEELAALGPEGLEAADRLARKYWNLPEGRNHVRNAIDVAQLSTHPAARTLLQKALSYPSEDIRLLGIEGLANFADPSDWEALHEALLMSSPSFAPRVVRALADVDPVRTGNLLLDWLEDGSFESIWGESLPLIARVDDPDVAARAAALWQGLPVGYGLWLATAAARGGDEPALEALEQWSRDEDATIRGNTAVALGSAEMLESLGRLLRTDPAVGNRKVAASALCSPPERIERTREFLSAGAADPDEEVSLMCLRALADYGDQEAIDRGLALLTLDGGVETRTGLRILSDAFTAHPGLAQRAFDAVTAELERQAHRPLDERTILLITVGRLPVPEAASYLLDAGLENSGSLVQGMPATKWFALQAGNIGEPAHGELLSRFADSSDAFERLNLLEALTLRGEASARDRVIELMDADALSPYELLFAADRLVRIGPAEVVAPVLKRETLRTDQDDVRSALQCLLWINYPGPE